MENKIKHNEEAILNSIDGIQPAGVPPYFYTRLLARMENELVKKNEPFFLLKPAFLTASLSLVLIVNIIFLVQFKGQQTPASKQSTDKATIESFADAYNLNATTAVYE